MISLARAHEVLSYDPDTGALAWKLITGSGSRGIGQPAGSRRKDGRITVDVDGRRYYAHRLIFFMQTGVWPTEVDHRDGNTSNNRWANLRACTHAQNQQNLAAKRALIGAHCVKGRWWFSRIRAAGKVIYLGYFDSAEQAHAAYLAAKRVHHTFCGTPRGG